MKGMKRINYYGRKMLIFIISVFVLSVMAFFMARLAPGDPLVSYYGERVEKMGAEEKAWAMHKLGLDESVFTQYVKWAHNAFAGNFGMSFRYKQDVIAVIGDRIGNTLLLGGIGFVLTFALALGLGILCAWYEDRMADRILCKIGTVTSCIPEFWLSLILIMVFAVMLKWLPSSNAYSIGTEVNAGDVARHLILPLAVVVISHLWYYAYMIRNKLLEEVREEYVLLAKSKGLSRRSIMLKHCLRGIMPTYFSIMAISVPHILGGTYIIEMVFSYPGIGTLTYESAQYHDYNLLMILCIITGIIVIFCNMLAQIINEHIDPRIKAEAVLETSEVMER